MDATLTRDYYHSRLLDIHKYSNHAEVEAFVNHIYKTHFKSDFEKQFKKNKKKINHENRKSHLKLVLLDLFIAWFNDPDLNISVPMSKNSYNNSKISSRGKIRYNELVIKDTILPIVRRLQDIGFIGFKKGWIDATTQQAHLSRIWVQPKLVTLFKAVRFHEFDISYSEKREVIILKDKKRKEIPYEDKPPIIEMRQLMKKYNNLIHQTFIDIPFIDKTEVTLPQRGTKKFIEATRIRITQSDKFVERVFSNASWDTGGKLIGGWWQKLNSDIRMKIWINNEPTLEIDCSAIHAILAYAEKGIYSESIKLNDPYDITLPSIDDKNANVKSIDPSDTRIVVKQLFLKLLAAESEIHAFQQFTNEWDYKKYPYKGVFKHKYLQGLLHNIKLEHREITDMFCSGFGAKLIKKSNQIMEHILESFLNKNVPILIINDGFLIPISEKDYFKNLIDLTLNKIMKKTEGQLNFGVGKINKKITSAFRIETNMISTDVQLEPSDEYKSRWNRHKKYFKISE